jgi:hypothetical protein
MTAIKSSRLAKRFRPSTGPQNQFCAGEAEVIDKIARPVAGIPKLIRIGGLRRLAAP